MNTADFTIYDLIARNGALYARREAVRGDGDQRLSFGEFHRRCDEYAAALRREGLLAGERIAILAGNEPDFLLLCGAAACLGAIVAPLNCRLGAEEMACILDDAAPRFLFCGGEFQEQARRASARTSSLEKRFVFVREEGKNEGKATGEERSVPPGDGERDAGGVRVPKAMVPEGDEFQPWPPGEATGVESAAAGVSPVKKGRIVARDESEDAGAAAGTASVAIDPLFRRPGGGEPFMIIHTAAVAGKPRGCVLSQDNLMATAAQLAHLLRLDDRDAYVGLLPLFHIGGMAMTLATMLAGGRNILVPRFDPPAVLSLLAGVGSAFIGTFPPMLGALLDAAEKGDCETAGLRLACGVDAPETIERFLRMNPRAGFVSLYGQTEAMPVSGGSYRDCPGGLGRPSLLTRVVIRDDLDEEVPPGTTGEICVRSPAVFQGYWGLPEDTAAAARGGWHHTGDLGRLDEEGFLWYAGRKPEKELIKTGGENVYPSEVEKALLAHEAIAEACVFGVPDPEWGEAVQAVCVLAAGARVSAGELGEFVAARIARYKKPKHVIFVAALPKTPAGAIDREAVKRNWGGRG